MESHRSSPARLPRYTSMIRVQILHGVGVGIGAGMGAGMGALALLNCQPPWKYRWHGTPYPGA